MVNFTVPTGDWIYPSQDTTSRARYPIDFPLVAEIFLPWTQVGNNVNPRFGIRSHLNGAGERYLELEVVEDPDALRINAMRGRGDEFLRLNHEFRFNPNDLYRAKPIKLAQDTDNNALFFADVLLLAYLRGDPMPTGITFRKARIPEIEHLGGR